jgi:hypothetical protein
VPLPPPVQAIADISQHVETRLRALFYALPKDHPIFGEPASGRVRLQMRARRSNGQSWDNWCKKLGASVRAEMGDDVPIGACWMSRKTTIHITRAAGSHGNQPLRAFVTVRLLAFLKDPSSDNWSRLQTDPSNTTIGQRPIDHPFSHACGNGATADNNDPGCINGLDHGRFATRDENESHKLCRNGARALCPGHGSPLIRCIFVHADGLPRPCRMVEDYVPRCQCTRRCFG